MADKIWTKFQIRGTRTPNPKFSDRVIASIHLDLYGDDPNETENDALLRYKKFKAIDLPLLDGMFADAAKKLTKWGFTQTGTLEWTATSVPDGMTRKIYKLFVKGLDDLTELGDKRAKAKGRSSHNDFDDDGKHKQGK